MATYYVKTDASGAADGTSEANAWTIAQMLSSAVAGDIIYIKSGVYDRDSSRFIPTNSGTSSDPIQMIGYKDTPGDLDEFQGWAFDSTTGPYIKNKTDFPKIISKNGSNVAFQMDWWNAKNLYLSNETAPTTARWLIVKAANGDITSALENCVLFYNSIWACCGRAAGGSIFGYYRYCEFDMPNLATGKGIQSFGNLSFCVADSCVFKSDPTISSGVGVAPYRGNQFNSNFNAGVIKNCFFYNFDAAIHGTDWMSQIDISNNTFVNCNTAIIFPGTFSTNSGKVSQNVFFDCEMAINTSGSTLATGYTYLQIFNNVRCQITNADNITSMQRIAVEGDIIVADPNDLFVDYQNKDFRILPGGPADKLNAGAFQPTRPNPEEIAEAVWTRTGRTLTG